MALRHHWLRRSAYVLPLIAAVLVAIAGWRAHGTVKREMQQNLTQGLGTLLAADVAALDVWMVGQIRAAEFAADQAVVRRAVTDLIDLDRDGARVVAELRTAPAQKALRGALTDTQALLGFRGYMLISCEGRVLSATREFMVGRQFGEQRLSGITRVLEDKQSRLVIPRSGGNGRRKVSRPARRPPGRNGGARPRKRVPPPSGSSDDLNQQLAVMVTTPVRDRKGEIVAALGLQIPAGEEFTRTLSVARMGKSGESFAFNRDGMMVTRSLFEDQLKKAGIVPDTPDATTVLTLELREPGVDITQGHRPVAPRADQPFTQTVSSALADGSGVNVDGYLDYRGVNVVGAWQWLEKHRIGVAVKLDAAEAFRPLRALERTFAVLISLLVAMSLGMTGYSLLAARLHGRIKAAELETRRLGQYRLERKIGEGGMGVVYQASHALLRRPTAIKLLVAESKRTSVAVGQFEREVQLTSQLSHPNTIQIYDYGRTDDGIFYYAMEYLDGINLRELVAEDGSQSPGRTIHMLSQVCAALAEAHEAGLIHRDIKPSNVIIVDRGRLADWVKVLDFGLVTQIGGSTDDGMSQLQVAGTPRYMAPEMFSEPDTVDARSDIYALGALGYFLLTSLDPFAGRDLADIREACLSQEAERFGDWSRHLEPDGALGELLLACLAPNREDRPETIGLVAAAMAACPEAGSWGQPQAREWWNAQETHQQGPKTATPSAPINATARIELTTRISDIAALEGEAVAPQVGADPS